MKLAFCLFKYFPFGGLQRDFLRIAQACVARGHEVDVFTTAWTGEQPAGLRVHIFPPCGWQNHTQNRRFYQQIQPKLNPYDLIIGFNKMPGLDLYYAADTCYQAKARAQRSAAYRLTSRYRHQVAFEQSVFAPAARPQILLLSEAQQPEFIRYYQTQPERFHLLPPGIDRNRIAPENSQEIREKIRSEWGIGPNQFLLLMVGSGFKTKGLDRAILGHAALPETLRARCQFFVIGEDDPLRYQRLARRLKTAPAIHFLGGRPDVPDFLLAADVLLHPAYNENTGTVLLEALASGLPVLTTAVCGYAPYVQKANAGIVLSLPFQQSAFNHALAHLLQSSDRALWSKHAKQFAKKTDLYSLVDKALQIIEKTKALPRMSFDGYMSLKGQVYRELEGRRTQRVLLGGQGYFIKQHFGVGWREIFKNALLLRTPVISAKQEWEALHKLKSLQVPVPEPIAFGSRGKNPARLQSFVLMRELTQVVSLEHYCENWPKHPPSFHFKQALIKEVARTTRILHDHGINHRDYYLCHFLLDLKSTQSIRLYLIDLHRARCRKTVPKRWAIKDLAGLYFSSLDVGLTVRDRLRFMREYRNAPLRKIINQQSAFWLKVKKRGDKLYHKQQ